MPVQPSFVTAARRVADDVLFPQASAVEAAGVVPDSHLAALAELGLFGIARDVRSATDFHDVVEALAGGCLATAFVWLQHHGLVRQLLRPEAPPALRDEWLDDLCRGKRRAGIAQAGLLTGRPRLVVHRHSDSVILDGSSPWVTGWGLVDVLLVAARDADDPATVVWLVLDAHDGERTGVRVEPLRLRAVDAARTVVLHLDAVRVAPHRVIATDPYDVIGYAAGTGLRTNGSLALGLTARCARLLAGTRTGEAIARDLDATRATLDASDDHALPGARAAACELAVRAAAALVVHDGGGAVVQGSVAGRLAEEATFLSVFGSRPSIRAALLDRLGSRT